MAEFVVPARINVLGSWVKVKVVKEIKDPNEYVYGQFDVDKNLITLRRGSDEEMKRTLFHELTHAILAYSGLREVINNENIEEGIACAFEYYSKLFDLNEQGFARFARPRRKEKA